MLCLLRTKAEQQCSRERPKLRQEDWREQDAAPEVGRTENTAAICCVLTPPRSRERTPRNWTFILSLQGYLPHTAELAPEQPPGRDGQEQEEESALCVTGHDAVQPAAFHFILSSLTHGRALPPSIASWVQG